MYHKLKSFYRYHIKGNWQYYKASKQLKTDQVPVVVYTMAKVGSMSVYKSLQQLNLFPVFHIHSFQAEKIHTAYLQCREKGWWPDSKNTGALIFEQKVKPKKPIKLITIVREPIERNISAFFEVFRFYNGVNAADYTKGITNLTDTFLKALPHQYPLNWLDVELKKMTGIDVYEFEFDYKKRSQVYKNHEIELLLFRIDLPDQEKEKILRSFLALEKFELKNYNVGARKDYAKLYRNFKDQLKLPDHYVNQMMNSKYCQHFYSPEEINTFSKQWF